jgi:hypothetical protein
LLCRHEERATTDRDLVGFCRLGLGQGHPQDPLLKTCLGLIGIDREWEGEAAAELTTPHLMDIPGGFRRLVTLRTVANRATQRHGVLVDGEVEVLGVHTGDRCHKDRFVLGGIDIEGERLGNPAGGARTRRGPERAERGAKEGLVEETVHHVSQAHNGRVCGDHAPYLHRSIRAHSNRKTVTMAADPFVLNLNDVMR